MPTTGPRVGVVALALVVALAAGCADDRDAAASDGRMRVVTTVAPITSLVGTVAGDRAEVVGLVPEGADSHTWEPPPSAAAALERADVVFVNGLGLDEPVRELVRAAGTEAVELGDRTIGPDEYRFDRSFPRSAGAPNPHLWTNPPMAAEYVRVAAGELARRDAGNAPAYRRNARALLERIEVLDRAMVRASATVPNRSLLTYHDAWAYFAARYGWDVLGAVQPSSFEDPSPREVASLVEQVRAARVPAVFGSEVFPSPVLAQIGREAGVRYVDVLRDDDLPGDPGDVEHSWLGLMRFDFVTMVEALGGDAATLRGVRLDGLPPDRAVYAR